MLQVKHFMDAIEPADGQRIWVEPFPLTRDLRAWCHVDHMLPQIGPPRPLWLWFQEHPNCYEELRGVYHEYLSTGRLNELLAKLAAAAARFDITLLHQGDDRSQNTATVLYEYLADFSVYYG
jgi:uncharacterized protein YeaO (DUF488 family)